MKVFFFSPSRDVLQLIGLGYCVLSVTLVPISFPTVVGSTPEHFPASLSSLVLFPGFGNSAPSKETSTEAGRAELLQRVLQDLEVKNVVLVSPSLSGHYALPFLIRGHNQLRGFVPIAPTYTKNYTQKQFWAVKVPEDSLEVLASYSWLVSWWEVGVRPSGLSWSLRVADVGWEQWIFGEGSLREYFGGGSLPGCRIKPPTFPYRLQPSLCMESWTMPWPKSHCSSSNTCPITLW